MNNYDAKKMKAIAEAVTTDGKVDPFKLADNAAMTSERDQGRTAMLEALGALSDEELRDHCHNTMNGLGTTTIRGAMLDAAGLVEANQQTLIETRALSLYLDAILDEARRRREARGG